MRRRIIFAQVLLSPFAGRDAKTLFEHGIEQAEMPVAAVVRDVDDFVVRVGEQLPRVQQPQFNLPRAERHAELLAEQAAEMPFAAIELPGQVPQRALGQFGLRHLADQLPETFMQPAAPGGFHRRRRQQTGDGVRPKLQQPATHGQALPLCLFRQPREPLRPAVRRR